MKVMENPIEIMSKIVQSSGLEMTDVDELEEMCPISMPDGLGLKLVHSEGGFEGGGDYVERVFAITDGDQDVAYVRLIGYYSSYNGTSWGDDDPEVVYPKEVTVTQYFKKEQL